MPLSPALSPTGSRPVAASARNDSIAEERPSRIDGNSGVIKVTTNGSEVSPGPRVRGLIPGVGQMEAGEERRRSSVRLGTSISNVRPRSGGSELLDLGSRPLSQYSAESSSTVGGGSTRDAIRAILHSNKPQTTPESRNSIERALHSRVAQRLSVGKGGHHTIAEGLASVRAGMSQPLRRGKARPQDWHEISFEMYNSDDDDGNDANSIVAMDAAAEQSDTTVLDHLVENQRGWFLFGFPFFSSDSLFPWDPKPWTSRQGKAVGGDPSTFLLPDESWKWKWNRWYVDMSGDVDDQGWSYSYRFGSDTWHGSHVPFHSFTRRRQWARLRQKRRINPRAVYGHNLEEGGSVLSGSAFAVDDSRLVDIPRLVPKDESTTLLAPGTINELFAFLQLCRLDRERIQAIGDFLLDPKNVGPVHILAADDGSRGYLQDIIRSLDFNDSVSHLLRYLDKVVSEDTRSLAVSPQQLDSLGKIVTNLHAISKQQGHYGDSATPGEDSH